MVPINVQPQALAPLVRPVLQPDFPSCIRTYPHSVLGLVDAVFSAWQTASQPSLPSTWTSPHTLMSPHHGPDSFPHQTSLVAQTVKNLPAVWETQVQSLGWEDPLEKAMATHSSIPAWKIPWMEEPGRLQWDSKESDTTEQLHWFTDPCLALTHHHRA